MDYHKDGKFLLIFEIAHLQRTYRNHVKGYRILGR